MVKEKRLTYETRQLVKKARDEDVRSKTNITALEKQFTLLDRDIKYGLRGVKRDLVVR